MVSGTQGTGILRGILFCENGPEFSANSQKEQDFFANEYEIYFCPDLQGLLL